MVDERDIEDVWLEGLPNRELSQEWTGETFFEPIPPPCKAGYTGVQGQLTRTQKTNRPPNVMKESWLGMSTKCRKAAIDEWAVKSVLIEDARRKRAQPNKQLAPDEPVVAPDAEIKPSRGVETSPDAIAKLTMTGMHETRGAEESQIAENKPNQQLPLVPSDTEEEDEQPQPKTENVKADAALGSGQLLHDGAKPEKLVLRGVADSETRYCDMKLKENNSPQTQTSTT